MLARDVARRIAETDHGDACVPWPLCVGKDGYGQIWAEGTRWTASRYVCTLAHGEPANPRMQAAHSCRNRACVNPRHLSWESVAGNQMHRVRDKTSNRGEAHGQSKLTDEDVRLIRKLYSKGWTLAELAEMFGVSSPTIHRVVKRTGWVHI